MIGVKGILCNNNNNDIANVVAFTTARRCCRNLVKK